MWDVTVDTAALQVVLCLVVHVRVVEHGFGRDAPDVETRPAQRPAFFDTSRLPNPHQKRRQ